MGWQAHESWVEDDGQRRRVWDWASRHNRSYHTLYPPGRDDEAFPKMEALDAVGWRGRVDNDGNPCDGRLQEGSYRDLADTVVWGRSVRDGGHRDGQGW